MRFLNFGLLSLSSLFAAGYAAPTAQVDSLVPVNVNDAPGMVDGLTHDLATRGDQQVRTKLEMTIVEVKKHTSKINSTVENDSSSESKEDCVKLIKGEVAAIISLVNGLVGEVVELLTGTVEIVGEEKDAIISLVVELIFEILFTLKAVVAALKISIFDLLGSLVFVLLSVLVHLLCSLNCLIDGLLKIVCGLLAAVIGILLEVLKGLLPIILGLVGGLLEKLNLSGLLCGLLG